MKARPGIGRGEEGVARKPAASLIPLALAAAAILVCSRHLDWGLPEVQEEAFPMKKAFQMCGWGTGDMTLDPQTAGWPSLSFYVHMLVQHLQYGIGRLSGAFADRGDFFLLSADMTDLALWARWVGVLCAAATVGLTARLGGLLAGKTGALLAGGTLLISPLLVRHAQQITPDIILTACAALALERSAAACRGGRPRDYAWAGAAIGLGASAKYTPVFLIPALVLAHLLRTRQEQAGAPRGQGRGPWRALRDRRLWWAALACAAAFAATSPYLLFDRGVLARDVELQVGHLQGGHFGHESQRPGPLFYLVDVLGPGLGWPAAILGLAGLAAAAARRRGPWLVAAVAFAAYFLALSLWRTRFDRYLLPALPPVALGVAVALPAIARRLQERTGGPAGLRAGIVAALAVTVLLPPALATGSFLRAQGMPGTLEEARDWILRDLKGSARPGGPYLAMELYTPDLPRDRQLRVRMADPALPHLSEAQRRRFLDVDPLPVVYLPFYSTDPHAADFYYDIRHFLQYDFVVTSSLVRDRYERQPALYPQQAKFYRDLQEYAPAVREFAPAPGRRGPRLVVYGITDNTRERVARELPPLTQETFRRAAAQVAASHFQDFVKTVAEHALARGSAEQAALYYQPLYETTPPQRRQAVLPAYAQALVLAGRWSEAEPLLRQWRALAPDDPRPAAYLQQAAEITGKGP